jgi:preprotein translocase subunit SecF
VQYDRLKDNVKKYPHKDIKELIDLTINEMLGRTVLTSGSTSLAVFAFYFLGGEVLYGFSTAMVWGMIAGCASSIYIAMPLLALFKLR